MAKNTPRVQICTRVQKNLHHLEGRSKFAPGCKFLKHRSHGQKYNPGANLQICHLSLVHVRNLHPGANLQPGCKFAPRVYFWPCERCFKNLHPGADLLHLSRWSKFICTRVQIVHMNAKCIILYIFIGDFDLWQAFSITILYKTDIKMNLIRFVKIKIRLFIMADQTTR